MPRDLPLGNGSLLVNFDASYQLRDLYWPHVGLENHSNGHVVRFGVWVDGRFRWLDDPGWSRRLRYADETLVTEVELSHPDLEIELRCRDAVDFHQNLYLRQIDVRNPTDRHREVRFFFHHDLYISSHEVGDTAYYEPERRAVYHYKGPRWFLINTATPGKQPEDATDTVEGWHIGVHQWACGHKGANSLQGTWKDAEDGLLSGNPIAQGSVDSTVAAHLTVPPQMTPPTYYWLAAGSTFEEVTRLNRSVRQRGPWHFINRTAAYWHLWLDTHRPDFADLPSDVSRIYLLSLLILRTQIDNGGAILAANDSDIASTVRDTYSYMWPRDGALTAHALDLAGYLDLTRPFYRFCREVLSKEGFLLHKYNPDQTLASSWHPWIRDGRKELPIQEDVTALVICALWLHFQKWTDIDYIKPLFGLWYFGMFPPDDPRITETMNALQEGLRVKTSVGGIARYENDYYHQQSQDLANVPGNPWFICTLWLAQWAIATARTKADLKPAVALFEWCVHHGLPSGVLAEQVHPYTHAPLSVSPLTWSHATFVMAGQEDLAHWRGPPGGGSHNA